MRWKLYKIKVVSLVLLSIALFGCVGREPSIDDQFTMFTPIFADNRVYFLKARNVSSQTQDLEALGTSLVAGEEAVPRNAPLSVIMRSVEMPAAQEVDEKGNYRKTPVSGPADYAVILDVGTNDDGTTKSMVVWYQRGVQPDQSLNFSNLLVYYEPRWDERVAPSFRIRVMDVTKERNAETRRALERAHSISSSVGSVAANPLVTPLIGIAFTAAELIFSNKQNRMLLDYSVQLYSSASVAQAGSGELGMLKRGSYIVIGRSSEESRDFWRSSFVYDAKTHALLSNGKRINVPTAAITIGTFESIVPTIVMERSVALTTLLSSNGSKSSVEQIDDTSKRLAASVEAFTSGEKLNRYRSHFEVDKILSRLQDNNFIAQLGTEDQFFLLRAISQCFNIDKQFASIEEAEEYRLANPSKKCEDKK
nr:hypothetical protein [uncultured Pseudomonas sp.]